MRNHSNLWPIVAAATTVWALVATLYLFLEPAASVKTHPPVENVATEPGDQTVGPTESSQPENTTRYLRVEFAELPGWSEDDFTAAAPALKSSCSRLAAQPDSRALQGALGGTIGDWKPFCAELSRSNNDAAIRRAIESLLSPVEVDDSAGDGLFTGYYEPTLSGSRSPSERYNWPLYKRPPELVELDLGQFRDSLAGQKILGHVRNRAFEPYYQRSEIDGGRLQQRGLELAWVDDPVDAFFLHIQGSGRVELDDGSVLRLGYAGQNGHAYWAIGRELVQRGSMKVDEVSMQSIRAWLDSHPDRRVDILHTNPSYIFFRELSEAGPVGSLGVALTPRRSLAVDPKVVPLGTPVWLSTSHPGETTDQPFQRLMSAQDTGGAIRGAQRGDVFWGPGAEAAEIAGRMKQTGRIWMLVPKSMAARAN